MGSDESVHLRCGVCGRDMLNEGSRGGSVNYAAKAATRASEKGSIVDEVCLVCGYECSGQLVAALEKRGLQLVKTYPISGFLNRAWSAKATLQVILRLQNEAIELTPAARTQLALLFRVLAREGQQE